MNTPLAVEHSSAAGAALLKEARAKHEAVARLIATTPKRAPFRKKNRSAFTNFLRAKYEAYTGAVDVRSYPYYLSVDPSDICQLRCPTCPTGIENERKRGPAELKFVYRGRRSILPVTLFDAILEEVGEYLFLIMFYNYGEPLLNKKLPELIAKARARDIETEIHTNLSLPLTDRQIDEVIGSGLDYLNASIDGFSQQTYEVHRVGGDLDLVKRNLERLVEARSRLGAATEITFKFLVFKHNEHEIAAAHEYCRRLGIRFIYGDAFIGNPSWLPSHRADEQPYYSDAEIDSRVSEWETLGQPDYWSEEEKRTVWYPQQPKVAAPPFCSWHYGVSVVTAGGPVAPCCAAAKEVDDFGTIVPGAVQFADIWNNDRVRRSRAAFAGKDVAGLEHADSLCLRCYFPKFVQQIFSIQDAKVVAQFYRELNDSEPVLAGAFDLLMRGRYTAVERSLLRRGAVHEFLLSPRNEQETGAFVEYFEQHLADEAAALPYTSAAVNDGRVVDLPFRLAFGTGSAWTWMRSGWHQDESWNGETARWSKGRRSVIALPSLPPDRDLRVDLDCQPFVFPGCGAQRIAVAVNDVVVDDVLLSPDRSIYSVVLPASRLRPAGNNRLELRYAYARQPRKVVPDSSDTRLLAVAWYSITFAELAS